MSSAILQDNFTGKFVLFANNSNSLVVGRVLAVTSSVAYLEKDSIMVYSHVLEPIIDGRFFEDRRPYDRIPCRSIVRFESYDLYIPLPWESVEYLADGKLKIRHVTGDDG